MSVLTAIRSRFAERQADADEQFAEFVQESAQGGDVDLATLNHVLSLTNRTHEQFVEAVEKIERRAAARLKMKEAARLQPEYEKACKASGEAANAVDAARKAAEKLVDDALRNLSEKGEQRERLSQQINELRREAREDLLETADPQLADEISWLESQMARIREEGRSIGREAFCDSERAIAAHRERNAEEARIQERITELRRQQFA